ncbi:MAG: hypothetical protein M1837_006578 [Sclerophora amabilis]|nr:MAG: hypothetical protein M1837_006578 [Sclerophora amabilis]
MTERLPNHPRRGQSEDDVAPQIPALGVHESDFSLESLAVADGFHSHPLEASSSGPGGTSGPIADREPGTVNATDTPSAPTTSSTTSQRCGAPQRSTSLIPTSTIEDGTPQRTASVVSASTVSDLAPTPHRSMSIASSFTKPRIRSLSRGLSGPAHPYAMYSQGTTGLARTASVVSDSTVRMPEQAYSSEGGPQHPYAMYPQNVLPDGDSSGSTITNPLPVGFPGMASIYHRRQGPEGEDAVDIIGPDGHTEQLPPYTRYPTNTSPKDPQANASPGIGLPLVQTQHPGPSQDSLHSPQSPHSQSRLSTRSAISESSGARLNEAHPPTSEKNGNLKETWNTTKNKRLCGGRIPMWLVIIAVAALVVISTVVGGVVGATLARRNQRKSGTKTTEDVANSPPASVVTITKDYSPLPTLPPNLPQLPIGNYSIPMPYPSESTSTCVDDTEPSAWSCLVSPTSGMLLQVLPKDGSNSNFFQILQVNTSRFPQLGMQAPTMNQPLMFSPVMDNEDPKRGPAYFFQITYNKTVIVAANKLEAGSRRIRSLPDLAPVKRDDDDGPDPNTFGFRRNDAIQVGDQPWYCNWDNTVLQGFVYLTLNSSGSLKPSTTTVTSKAKVTPSGLSVTGDQPSERIRYPNYPKVIKLDEQRNLSSPDYVGPYCQRMQVLESLEVVPAIDADGQQITIYLDEDGSDDEIEEEDADEYPPHASLSLRKRADNSACHCQWELL